MFSPNDTLLGLCISRLLVFSLAGDSGIFTVDPGKSSNMFPDLLNVASGFDIARLSAVLRNAFCGGLDFADVGVLGLGDGRSFGL